MPNRFDDEYAAIELLTSQLASIVTTSVPHRAMAATVALLRQQMETAIKALPFDPHPDLIELHIKLGKFADSVVSRGRRTPR